MTMERNSTMRVLSLVMVLGMLLFLSVREVIGWGAQCSTTWNGSSWASCISDAVTATSGGEATVSVSAPACAGDAGSRYARAMRGMSQVARVDCSGNGACCATDYWDAEYGLSYAARGYNTSTVYGCGPTTAAIHSGHIDCQGS